MLMFHIKIILTLGAAEILGESRIYILGLCYSTFLYLLFVTTSLQIFSLIIGLSTLFHRSTGPCVAEFSNKLRELLSYKFSLTEIRSYRAYLE